MFQLFSAGLEQNGEDNEGILGFLPKDIKKELKRGEKLVCLIYKGFISASNFAHLTFEFLK